MALLNFASVKQKIKNNKHILVNISWLSLDKLVRMSLALIVNIWVARYLGPGQFGLWNYAIAYVAIYLSLATLSFDGIVVRELVGDGEKKNQIMSTAFLLRLLSGTITWIPCVLIAFLIRDNHVESTIILITSTSLVIQAIDVSDVYFQSKVRSRVIVISKGTIFLLSTLGKVLLILNSCELIYFVWLSQAELLFGGVMVTFFFLRESQNFRLDFSRAISRTLLRDGWPLIITGALITIHMKIDQVMLQHMTTEAVVGNYSVGVKLSEIWYLIPMLITNSLLPGVLSIKSDIEAFRRKLQSIYDFMTWISIAASLTISLTAHWLMNLLYGSAYSQAGDILAIYIWTTVPVFLGTAGSMYFLAVNNTRLALIRLIVGIVINIPVNLILIPLYQGIGASVATIISYFISLYAVDFFYARDNFFMIVRSLNVFRIVKQYLL